MNAIEYEDFTGEPERVLMKIKPKKGEENEEENQEPIDLPDDDNAAANPDEDEVDIGEKKRKYKKKNKQTITELERLAFVVRAIENECAIVPVGSVKIMPNHQLR